MKILPFPPDQSLPLLHRIAYWVLIGMAATSPMGYLTRLGQFSKESTGDALGAVTILTVSYIGLTIINGSVLNAVRKYPAFCLLFVLTGWACLATLIQGQPPIVGIYFAARMITYYLVMLGVMGSFYSDRRIALVALTFTTFMGICCILSLADYFHFVNIPQVNVMTDAFKTEGMMAVRIDSLTGPFGSRTMFAIHLSLAVIIAAWYTLLKGKSVLALIVGLGLLGVLAISSAISQSRGLFLGIPIAIVYMTYKQGGVIRHLPKLIMAAFAIVAAVGVFMIKNPDLFYAFTERAKGLLPSEFAYSSSGRFAIWSNLLDELIANPQGIGFTRVAVQGYGDKDVHNTILNYLKYAGPIGLVMVVIAFIPLIKVMLRRALSATESAIEPAIICIGIYGLTHSVESTLFLWVYVGFALSHYFRPVPSGPHMPPHPLPHMPRPYMHLPHPIHPSHYQR